MINRAIKPALIKNTMFYTSKIHQNSMRKHSDATTAVAATVAIGAVMFARKVLIVSSGVAIGIFGAGLGIGYQVGKSRQKKLDENSQLENNKNSVKKK